MKFLSEELMTSVGIPSCMQSTDAAAAFKALCLPSIFKLRSKFSDSDLRLKDDLKSLE